MLAGVASVAACLGLAVISLVQLRVERRKRSVKDREVEFLISERQNERQGRIKAEKALREMVRSHGMESDRDRTQDSLDPRYPLRPIGFLKSCFRKRNGTPRQPLLVPAARSCLELRPELSPEFFDGLENFSHVWIVYLFHENTDFQKLWQESYAGIKAKIRVPRLNASKLGVFATRSPHRPCPIGLSVARILQVDGRKLILGGADIVDGSPVLDIKPYLPFCDSVRDAEGPSWVTQEADDEPLKPATVILSDEMKVALFKAWTGSHTTSLYDTFDDFLALVMQVLSRDFRSVTQRIKVPEREGKGMQMSSLQATTTEGKWRVCLDGVDIIYDLHENGGRVVIQSVQITQ